MVPSAPSLLGRLWLVLIPSQPIIDDVVVKLFGPKQPSRSLSGHILRFLIQTANQMLIELISFDFPLIEDSWICLRFAIPFGNRDQPELHRL